MSKDFISPATQTVMKAVHFRGFTVYQDPSSGGHWLPRGVLKGLAERQLELELPPLLDIDEATMHHSGRFCPEDELELVEYAFAGSEIRIEQCLTCNGIWLDAGELKKLMAYVFEHTEAMSQTEYDESSENLSNAQRILFFLYKLTERPPWF